MKKKAALLIDGGYLRVLVRKARKTYDPTYIERVALACFNSAEEELFRALYYDCAPYVGKHKLPVSGAEHTFSGDDIWLRELASKPLFAVRRGVLKFRGWKPRKIPVASATLKDSDFVPDFEQKGVDMRIGLDIALLSTTRAVERIILVTADTDCIPAMKHGRKAGQQIVGIKLPNGKFTREFLAHVDIEREVTWP